MYLTDSLLTLLVKFSEWSKLLAFLIVLGLTYGCQELLLNIDLVMNISLIFTSSLNYHPNLHISMQMVLAS